ncbi:MAG: toxin TcdB middle/N-terminal domain-containing protein [Myxococcota bacterium]
MLASVGNGRGFATRLRYSTSARIAAAHEDSGQPWSRNVSMILPVVAELETDDSRGNILVKAYDYRDPYYLRDELEQRFEFVGFSFSSVRSIPLIETTPGDPSTRMADPQDAGAFSRRWFSTGEDSYYLRGVELCEETWASTASPSTYTCDEDGALARFVKTSTAVLQANGLTTAIELTRVDQYVLEGAISNDGAHIRTEYEYDAFGNLTAERAFGVFDVDGDERMQEIDYIHNTDAWLVSLPRERRVGGMNTHAQPPAIEVLEATCNEYDSVSALCNASLYVPSVHDIQVTQGLVKKSWVLDDENPTDSTVGTWTLVSQMTHLSNGLNDTVVDALGAVLDIDYDADFGYFESQRSIDPSGLNLVSTSEVDPKHGQVTRSSTPDGVVTEAVYDDLGRMTKMVKPGDTLTDPPIVRAYHPGSPISTIVELTKDGTANGLRIEHRMDAMGRRLCTIREDKGALSSITFQQERAGRGLAVMDYVPTKATGCDSIQRDAVLGRTTTRAHATHLYDAQSRRIQTTHAPSNAVATESYAALSRTETDEAGRSTTRTTNGLGYLVEVIEHLDLDQDGTTEDYTMSFGFDPRGHLVEVTNELTGVHEVIYTARFDSRGRLVQSWDAARGLESVAYNTLDQIERTVDARGYSIDFTYDAAGRKVSEVSTNPLGVSSPPTTYDYDAPSGCAS